MPRLANNIRSEAIGMLRLGMRRSAVGRMFNCHYSTIKRLELRYNATGNVTDRQRTGRPRITTRRQDGTMRMLHRRYHFRQATTTARAMIGGHG